MWPDDGWAAMRGREGAIVNVGFSASNSVSPAAATGHLSQSRL